MSEFALPPGFVEVSAEPAAPLPPGFEEVEPVDLEADFQPASSVEALSFLRQQGPGAELDYLDGKHNRLEKLDFGEWKRREELVGGLDFWDKHVARNATAVGDALGGLWSTVTGAVKEAAGIVGGLVEGELSPLAAYGKVQATGLEAGLLGAVDFTDLVTGVSRVLGGPMDMYGLENTKENWQKVHFEHYQERQDARRERAALARDSALGTVAGGLAGGRTDVQAAVGSQVLPSVAELGALVTPTNPLNIVPFGAGAKAATLTRAGMAAAAVTAEKTALAARWVAEAAQIGDVVQLAARTATPTLAAADAVVLGKRASALAIASALASGATAYGSSDGNVATTLVAAFAGHRLYKYGALRASNAATRVAEGSEFLAAVSRAATQGPQGPRLQSTLARVARDPSVPSWAATTAKTLDNLGATQVARAGRSGAAGAVTGATVSAGLAAVGGGDEQEVAGALVSGATAGGLLGVLGGLFSRASGADQALRTNTERLLFAEAQRDLGGDHAAALFYGLPESEQLALGTIQAIAGPAVPIEVVDAARFRERTNGDTGAGVFLPTPRSGMTGTILVNAEASRPAGVTALHEFSHALASRQNPDEVKAHIQSLATPEELAAFETDYLRRIVAEKRASGQYVPEFTEKFDDLGFQIKTDDSAGRNAADAARAREELAANDPNWLFQEFFAEKGAEALGKVDLAKVAITGQWEPDAARSLRVKQSVLRNAGVAFNADGSVIEPTFIGKALNEQGDKGLGSLLSGYVKEAADYGPRLNSESKKLEKADAGKVAPINFGPDRSGIVTHPAYKSAFTPTADGGKESVFAVVTPEGKVAIKPEREVKRTEATRIAELHKLFPRTVPKITWDESPLVALRDGPEGPEISGTVLPPAFFESDAFPKQQRDAARVLQREMNSPPGEKSKGGTVRHWYYQIGHGSSGTWAQAVKAKLGNLQATMREIRPLSFLITQKGNLAVRVLDMSLLKARAQDYGHAGKLAAWAGNLDAFNADIKKVMANWSQGRPGDEGVGATQYKEIGMFMGLTPEGALESSRSLVKTFRLDRMADVEPTGQTGFTFDYPKWKHRLSPDVAEPVR